MATTFNYFFRQFFFVGLIFCATNSYAQEYGVIPPTVRALMDANKLNGLPAYTGIVTAYFVHCEGLESSELLELQTRAQNISSIQTVAIQSPELIEVICSGGTSFDQVKNIFSSLVTHITSVTIENRIGE